MQLLFLIILLTSQTLNVLFLIQFLFIFRFGPRFVDVSEIYDEDLINIAYEAANEVGLGDNVNEGTLAMLGGPTFETPAELRMLKVCGVDAVGKENERTSYKSTSL